MPTISHLKWDKADNVSCGCCGCCCCSPAITRLFGVGRHMEAKWESLWTINVIRSLGTWIKGGCSAYESSRSSSPRVVAFTGSSSPSFPDRLRAHNWRATELAASGCQSFLVSHIYVYCTGIPGPWMIQGWLRWLLGEDSPGPLWRQSGT